MDIFRKQSPPAVTGAPDKLKYARQLDVELNRMTHTQSGLYYLDREVGGGAMAEREALVSVGYRGWLANGVLFDQSGEGRPIKFRLGHGEVISGWDEGIAGMKVGCRRLLVIPPELAYGQQSPGAGIPANATLVFDVTLVGAEAP